jgi:hypothetical protein
MRRLEAAADETRAIGGGRVAHVDAHGKTVVDDRAAERHGLRHGALRRQAKGGKGKRCDAEPGGHDNSES